MNELTDIWLPIGIALVGVGGTIAVTAMQLRARRRELDADRQERAAMDLDRRREDIITAVYDSMGPLVSAAVVPLVERDRPSLDATRAVSRVERVIRLSRRDDVNDLRLWWSVRSRQFARVQVADLEALEVAVLTEIDRWYDGELTASDIRGRAVEG